jgi:hypothetical protein
MADRHVPVDRNGERRSVRSRTGWIDGDLRRSWTIAPIDGSMAAGCCAIQLRTQTKPPRWLTNDVRINELANPDISDD